MKFNRMSNYKIRPNGTQKDALANEVVEHSEGQEDEEEGRAISGQKMLYQPSQQEWDDHQRTHIPFRKWCPFCVRGKCTTGAHKRGAKSDEEIEKEVHVISMDYMGPKSRDHKADKIDSLPIVLGVDRKSKWVFAHMVPNKGLDPHAVKMVNREIRIAG